MTTEPRIAIIGAGLSGLTLARALKGRGELHVFDKSRGVGGRMSTRRAAPYAFDHGAQYFTAHGAGFRAFLAPFIADGTVRPWAPRLVRLSPGKAPDPIGWNATRYVAQPGMNGLARALAEDIGPTLGTEVARIARQDGGWALSGKDGAALGQFDWVVSTAPALQTRRLMPPAFSGLPALEKATMQGCYSLMLGFGRAPDLGWDAAQVVDAPLGWIAVNSSKPGRGTPFSLIAHAANGWAEANLERDQDDVRAELLAVLAGLTGLDVAAAGHVGLHRWRYSSVAVPAGEPCLIDPERGLAACGDWCGAGKVEAAFDSASALAGRLVPLL